MSKTLYKDTVRGAKNEIDEHESEGTWQQPSKTSKVNKICDAFLTTLENRLDTNLRNLITAHVCKSPPDLEAGLRLAASLRG